MKLRKEKWKEFTKSAPSSPGVYLFKNASGKPIYVGKSENLGDRIRSYAKGGDGRFYSSRIYQETEDVEYFITSNSAEALFLEDNLIKTMKPLYNIRLKDDKTYISIALNLSSDFPRIMVMRRPSKEKNTVIFGPFSSAGIVREMIRYLLYVYPLRTCSDSTFKNRKRPCIEYEMGRCPAPCVGLIGKEEYKKTVNRVKKALKKGDLKVEEEIERRMNAYAEQQKFEEAAKLRDVLFNLRQGFFKISQNISFNKDTDVIGVIRRGDLIFIAVLSFRTGVLSNIEKFKISDVGVPLFEVLERFLKEFYSKGRFVPERIIVNEDISAIKDISYFLTRLAERKVKVSTPQNKDERLAVETAVKNSEMDFAIFSLYNGVENLEKAKELLNLSKIPEWIEAYDISRYGNSIVVGSSVAMVKGTLCKDLYRRYRIKGSFRDDYECMREILKRRLKRAKEENAFPDLLVLDGGRGHLNAGIKVLEEMEVSDRTSIIAISKPGDEKKKNDVIHTPRQNIILYGDVTKTLSFIQLLRDEAHRFAISYLKKLDNKIKLTSELENIPGIGKKRAGILLRRAGSLRNLMEMDFEELKKLPGLGERYASRLYAHLHREGKR